MYLLGLLVLLQGSMWVVCLYQDGQPGCFRQEQTLWRPLADLGHTLRGWVTGLCTGYSVTSSLGDSYRLLDSLLAQPGAICSVD